MELSKADFQEYSVENILASVIIERQNVRYRMVLRVKFSVVENEALYFIDINGTIAAKSRSLQSAIQMWNNPESLIDSIS